MKYRAVLRCGSCGAVINKTQSATTEELIDNHFMIAATSVFAGDCPKGCRPTFSDCNLRTQITYEDETGERLTFEEIKKREVIKMKVKEIRTLSVCDFINLCIENDWYTSGTAEEYDKILTYAGNCTNITTEDITKIAQDIIDHSGLEWQVNYNSVLQICCLIATKCRSCFIYETQKEGRGNA